MLWAFWSAKCNEHILTYHTVVYFTCMYMYRYVQVIHYDDDDGAIKLTICTYLKNEV